MSTPQAPTGTVTFLFTDIEGSTELVKRLGGAYGELLAAHRRLLREAFAAEGGQEMGTEGDALFYWFPRVRQAVRAAVAAQRVLAEHPWPDGSVVRVRMGLHTGEADVVESEFVGMGVHRAARVASAAHGGQVLLSPSTAGVVSDERLPGVSVRELGDFVLKDIDRPERLHQLEIEGLPSEFPPPRAPRAEPSAAVAATPALAATPRRRSWLVPVLVLLGLLVAGAVAAILLLGGGGSERAATTAATTTARSGATSSSTSIPVAQTLGAASYVHTVDGLLVASQPTLNAVKTFVQDVQDGRLAGDAAISRAHGFVLQRQNLLEAAGRLQPPTSFDRAQSLFLRAVRLSLQDDQELETYARAQVAGDRQAADAALKRAIGLGTRTSAAKDAFLREYGSARLVETGRSPSTLPSGF